MYLKDKPCGEDLFESSAHKRIASAIGKVIQNESLDIDIIGLEGDWGSGKSNVIEIVNNHLEDSHHFFIYDAWGHQEDLQRRSFLEELTQELCINRLLEDSSKWKEKLENLLARKTKRTTKTVPKLNMKLFYLFIALFLNGIFQSINFPELITVTNFFTKEFSLLNNITKELLLILLRNIPILILIIWFLISSIKKSKKDKDAKYKEILKFEINELLQIYRKEELENTVETITSTREPSVREFKNWMEKLSDELTKDLVVVFDNMDRLPQEKAKDLWASIHTFFSENDYDKIHVIVPFDRAQIRKIFSDEENNSFKKNNSLKKNEADRFIDKTFELVYRVTPPVISDWKSYFKLKFREIEFSCEAEEIVVVRNLFDKKHDYIKPREIILFLNELYLYYSIWGSDIPLKYIALFILNKDEILDNPLQAIINEEYLEGIKYLFDEKHQKYISALVFNVDPEKASQVLLSREIDRTVANEDIEKFELLTQAFAFDSIFENKVTEIDENYENYEKFIVVIYQTLFKKEDKKTIFKLSNEVLYKAFSHSNLTDYKFSEYIQYLILMNINKAEKILKYYLDSIEVNHDIKGDEYHKNIMSIEKFIKDNDISFELKDKINPITLSLEEMYNYTRVSKIEDSVYKIKTDTKKLSAELVEMINSNGYNLEIIELLKYMPDNLNKLNEVKSLMKEKINNNQIPYNKIEGAYKIVFAFQEPSKDYLLDTRFLGQHLNTCYTQNEEYAYILTAMLITQMEDKDYINPINGNYRQKIVQLLNNNGDDTKTEGVCKYIRNFIGIGDLFEIILKHESPLLNVVAKKLMTKSSNTLRISYVLKNYDSIISKLSIQDDQFVSFLDEWSSDLIEYLENKDIVNILTSVNFVIECFNNEYEISKIIIDQSIAYFEKMKYDYFENMFTNDLKSSSFMCFYKLLEEDYLTEFTSDMKLAFRAVLENNIRLNSLDEDLKSVFNKMYVKIKKNSLQTSFRSIRDRLILKLDVLSIDKEFYIPLIMRHSRLHERPDESIKRIIIPILKEESHLIINEEFKDKMILIANKSESEKIHLKEMLESIDQKDLAIKIKVDDTDDKEEYNEEVN